MKTYYPALLDLLRSKTRSRRVLELGCGEAEFLTFAHRSGFDVAGYDIAEHAGLDADRRDRVAERLRAAGLEAERVKWSSAEDGIPFDSGSFDVILSVQVLEHVADLPRLFAEIDRVLKPGGIALHYFPTKRILIEPHSGIPFAHWAKRIRREVMQSLFFAGKYWKYRSLRGYTLRRFIDEFDWYLAHLCHFRTMRMVSAASRRAGLPFQFLSLYLPTIPAWLSQYFTSIILIQAKAPLRT